MTAPHDDDLPDSPAGEHALASRLGREGASAQPSAQELGEGRRLSQAVDEAWQDVRDRSVWEG